MDQTPSARNPKPHTKAAVNRAEEVAALDTTSAMWPVAAQLPEADARLLDQAGFPEDPGAHAVVTSEVVAQNALVLHTAVTTQAVASALGIKDAEVRRRRANGSFWAIKAKGRWLFPLMQFNTDSKTSQPLEQIRGLDDVFRALPREMHPVAVAGFLRTPKPDLTLHGPALSPLDWLRDGGDVASVLRLAQAADWASC